MSEFVTSNIMCYITSPAVIGCIGSKIKTNLQAVIDHIYKYPRLSLWIRPTLPMPANATHRSLSTVEISNVDLCAIGFLFLKCVVSWLLPNVWLDWWALTRPRTNIICHAIGTTNS